MPHVTEVTEVPEVPDAPEAPGRPVALLLTDLIDSAALAQTLGDAAMAAVWQAHDRAARDLLRDWRGREIDKTDGFLLLFNAATDALGYALDYHRALAQLEASLQAQHPGLRLRARAGLHVGLVTLRETPSADIALGAKPVEVDGLNKPLAARVMSVALGGQTLLTRAAVQALGLAPVRVVAHGHWRVKGLAEPLELFEAGPADGSGAPFAPPPDSDKVYRVVQQGDLWLPARELRHSLPAERDAFVGRQGSLQALAQRFEGGARLVSLLGIGGCGKTRLATRFGWLWLGDFPGGVWFCDLAPARGVEGIVHAVAQGLDVPLGKDDPVLQLGHAIAGRGACLVLIDNFEHLARHAEATLGHWLERAPMARFLVTSREVLGIAGEETLALAPLQADDAAALFMRRAAAAKRDFAPNADEQAAVAALVRLLDGLPLAIELAAARVRTLSPRALAARMGERFKLLASSGGRLDRQATLRATFDWSWELLSGAERAALAQLSVFEGGFTLEAAEAVIALQPPAPADPPPWTMDVVISLVDKSFVRPLAGERFDLLVSVQAYAAEHLQTEGRFAGSGLAAREAACLRHAQWFAALGPERSVQQGCADLDNLAVACRRAVAAGLADVAAGALRGAWAAISLHGPYLAGLELAQAVCEMPALQGHAAALAFLSWGHALEVSGKRSTAGERYDAALQQLAQAPTPDAALHAELLVRRGGVRGAAGRADFDQALAIAAQRGDRERECSALNGLGNLEFEQGRMAQAQSHYESALDVARQAGQRRWQGSLLGNLGNLLANIGNIEAALQHNVEALAIARELGDRQRECNRLNSLGLLSHLQGRTEEACTAGEAAFRLASELGHGVLLLAASGNLGTYYGAMGRWADALAKHQAALVLAEISGSARSQGQVLGSLGLAQAKMGDIGAAKASLARGRALLQDQGDPFSLGLLLCSLAEVEAMSGAREAARQAHAEARALHAASGAGPASELGVSLQRLQAFEVLREA
jgi:predicted ATPase/class 3 adenylate cyclase